MTEIRKHWIVDPDGSAICSSETKKTCVCASVEPTEDGWEWKVKDMNIKGWPQLSMGWADDDESAMAQAEAFIEMYEIHNN